MGPKESENTLSSLIDYFDLFSVIFCHC